MRLYIQTRCLLEKCRNPCDIFPNKSGSRLPRRYSESLRGKILPSLRSTKTGCSIFFPPILYTAAGHHQEPRTQMDRETQNKFYASEAWRKTRRAYCEKVNYLCEDCLQRGLYVPGVIVHHIQPITEQNINNPEITLNFNNLRLLCRSCHERIHRRKATRFKVDEAGHIIPLDE